MSNISKIESCDPKRLDECSARKYFDTGFESIRSAYLMIARCWIISESTKKYREFSSTALKRIENETMVPCANQCAGSNSCLSSCYVNKYEKWIKDELKAKFPQAASGC